MQILTGRPIMEQIVAGHLAFYRRRRSQPSQAVSQGWRRELERFHRAQQTAIGQLSTLYCQAREQVGASEAAIFSIHGLLLEDREYVGVVQERICSGGTTAEEAVRAAERSFTAAFAAMDSAYMRAREADIRDISQRVLRALAGERLELGMDGPAILVADDFLPSEVMAIDRRRLLGLIIRQGSLDSHTAMLVRAYHIPAMVEVELVPKWEGRQALMDGHVGRIYLDPTPALLEQLRERYQDRGRPAGL